MKETLSFLTDVRRSGASEARTSLRDARSRYDFEHLLDDAENRAAEALFRANVTGDWYVPAWAEGTEFATPVAAGATELDVHLFADWREGGFAFIRGADGAEVIEIDSVGTASIALVAPTTIDCDFAAPVRVAYAAGPLGGTRWWRGLSRRAISFVADDGEDQGASDFPTAGGHPVLEDPPTIVTPLEQVIDQARHFIDNGTGLVAIETAREVFDARHAVAFIDRGPEAIWRRKQVLHHLRGRDRAFWLPSWADDLDMAAAVPSAQAFIDVEPAGPDADELDGRWLQIDDGAGFLYRQVTAVAVVAGPLWRLTIAAPGRDIAAARLSLMTLMRLDTDEVAIDYVQRLIARTAAVCAEVAA